MPFETTWLTSEDAEIPTEQQAEVAAMRDFLSQPADLSAGEALASSSLEGLLSLVATLTDRQDGSRLAILKAAGLPKKARKAAGKAVHKLKTRGIACELPTGRVATIGYQTDVLPSFISVPLASGEELLLLSGRPYGQAVTCYAVADENGFEELVSIEEPSRTRIKRLIDRISDPRGSDLDIYFVEADPAYVRSKIQAAMTRHRAANKPLPEEWPQLQALIEQGDTHDGEHPARTLIGTVDASLVARSGELLGRVQHHGDHTHYIGGKCDRPVMEDDWQKAASQRLENAMESPVVVDDVQRRERVTDEVDRLADEVFDEAMRQKCAARLTDTAFTLFKRGDAECAAMSLATADALLDATQKTLDIPWCRDSIHGIIDIDMLLAGKGMGASADAGGHVHGPGCDHDHDHDHDHGDNEPLIIT